MSTETCKPYNPSTGLPLDGSSSSTGSGIGVLGILLLIVVVVTPIATTAYLTYRMRREPAAAMA